MRVEEVETMYKMKTILCKIKNEMKMHSKKVISIGGVTISISDIDKYSSMVDRFDLMLQKNREKSRIRMSKKRSKDKVNNRGDK